MDRGGPLIHGRHGKGRFVVGQVARMTLETHRFLLGYQARGTRFLGIAHDLGRPVVCSGTVAGFALHAGKRFGSGGMAPEALTGALFRGQPPSRPAMGRLGPREVLRTVTDLASLSADIPVAVISLWMGRDGAQHHRGDARDNESRQPSFPAHRRGFGKRRNHRICLMMTGA